MSDAGRGPIEAPAASAGRIAWPDVARGGVIILVVFAHAVQLATAYGWTMGWLSTLNLYLTALRMPLFFLVAGIFAARAVERSWPRLFASRLAMLIYLYLLWSVIRALWFSIVPWPFGEMPPWLALAVSPLWPTSGLWFLYALIVYTVIAKLTRRAPAVIVIVAAGLLSVAAASDVIPTGGNGVWRSVALYLFFFLLGVRFRELWLAFGSRAPVWSAFPAAALIPAAMLGYSRLPSFLAPTGRVALSVVCVAAAIAIAAALSRLTVVRKPLSSIGARTLPIYVVHTLLLGALAAVVPVGSAPTVVLVLLLTAVGVAVPLAIARLLRNASGVFSLPAPLARRLDAWASTRDARRALRTPLRDD